MTQKTATGFEFPDDNEYAAMVFEDAGELTINLADVKEMKFENIPKGNYVAEITQVDFGQSQRSGAHMLSLQWTITEGEYQGRKLPMWLSFSQKALPGTKANIARIDPELANAAFKPRDLAESGKWIGVKARIRVGLQDFEGEERSSIRGIMPLNVNGGAAAGGSGGFFSGQPNG